MVSNFSFPYVAPPENSAKFKLAIFQLVYGVPSVLIMLFLLIFLGFSKHYSNSFYRLVQMDLFMNIIVWFNTWVSLRSTSFPFCYEYVKFLEECVPGIWTLSIFLMNCFFHMQFCSAAGMSAHRVSSILAFNHYEKFWSRYYILIFLIYCGYSCLPQIPGGLPKMDLINGTLYETYDPSVTKSYMIKTVTFSIVYFGLLIGLGAAMPLVANGKFQRSSTDTAVSKKLTRIALTYVFVFSGIMAWTVVNTFQSLFGFLPDSFAQISYSILSVASDMMTLALPYILLIYDSNIKRDLHHNDVARVSIVPVSP